MAQIKNLLFDFGGVIVDLNREAAVKAFEAMGVKDADAMLSAYHQNGFFLHIEDGSLDGPQFCKRLAEHLGKPVNEADVAAAWLAFVEGVPAYKLEALEALRRRYRVFILSNTNPYVVDWFNSPAFTPEGRPLTDFAEKIYASCELKACKPDRTIFDLVLKDAGIRADETLFIDDGQANIDTAKALGFHTYLPANKEDWRGPIGQILVADNPL